MKRISSIALGIVLSTVVSATATAQWNVARFEPGQSRVYASFGLDPALVTTVGYSRVAQVFGHRFQFAADAGAAAGDLDANDYRVRLQVFTSLMRWRSVNVTGSASAITRGTKNAVYRGVNFGSDFTGTAGVYRPRWFAAGEFGFDKAVISHITHTDWYRQNVYADAKDGWYLNNGGTYHFGFTGGVAVSRAEIVARAGWLRTERFREMSPPYFASLGIGFGL